MVLLVVR